VRTVVWYLVVFIVGLLGMLNLALLWKALAVFRENDNEAWVRLGEPAVFSGVVSMFRILRFSCRQKEMDALDDETQRWLRRLRWTLVPSLAGYVALVALILGIFGFAVINAAVAAFHG